MLKKLHIPALAFALTAVIGAGVTYAVNRAEAARAQSRFDARLAEAVGAVAWRVGEDIAFLSATRAFFQSQEGAVPHQAFAAYVRGLGLSGPYGGLQGIGLAQIVLPGNEAALTERLARDYGATKGVWPESDQNLRTAIVLLEPADARNRAAIGFDMYTEARRRQAMARALATGEASATAPVELVQEITAKKQVGILVFLPLADMPPGAPQGFIYSPIRMGDLFDAALEGRDLPLELRATDAQAPDTPLFQSSGFAERARPGQLTSTLTRSIAGRDWVFLAQDNQKAGFLQRRPFTVLTASGVLLLSIATALAVQGMNAAVRKARALNQAQARLVREQDLHLREMSHRLKNALTRVAAMARQAARGAETKEEFVASMTARLTAMANAQDMLTRSATESTDLQALLMSEVSQIYGDATALSHVEGPPVRLDAQQTQAMGLTFHELATNSLKYGSGAVEGAALHIHWDVRREAGRRVLWLTWDERTGQPAEEPERKGFGSQLLDSCIRIELGGTVERRYHDGGFTIDLRVPLDAA